MSKKEILPEGVRPYTKEEWAGMVGIYEQVCKEQHIADYPGKIEELAKGALKQRSEVDPIFAFRVRFQPGFSKTWQNFLFGRMLVFRSPKFGQGFIERVLALEHERIPQCLQVNGKGPVMSYPNQPYK